MDKTGFSGKADEITNIPSRCYMNTYTAASAAANTDSSHQATDYWY